MSGRSASGTRVSHRPRPGGARWPSTGTVRAGGRSAPEPGWRLVRAGHSGRCVGGGQRRRVGSRPRRRLLQPAERDARPALEWQTLADRAQPEPGRGDSAEQVARRGRAVRRRRMGGRRAGLRPESGAGAALRRRPVAGRAQQLWWAAAGGLCRLRYRHALGGRSGRDLLLRRRRVDHLPSARVPHTGGGLGGVCRRRVGGGLGDHHL